jgi:hypothetical protein
MLRARLKLFVKPVSDKSLKFECILSGIYLKTGKMTIIKVT